MAIILPMDLELCLSLTRRAILFLATFFIFCIGPAHAQVRLSSEEAEKLVMAKTEPLYPPIAKAARAEGLVKVEVIVSEQGAVSSAKAISGHPLLQSAAVSAVRKHKYQAHMIDGKPVPFITEVYIRFPPAPSPAHKSRSMSGRWSLPGSTSKKTISVEIW